MPVQSYFCPELVIHETGIAQAFVLFTGESPTGIICDNYETETGRCRKKMRGIVNSNAQNYDIRYNDNAADTIKKRMIGTIRDAEKISALAPVIKAEIERQKQADLQKRLASDQAKCIITRGFQQIK
jgi:hypothetical protein